MVRALVFVETLPVRRRSLYHPRRRDELHRKSSRGRLWGGRKGQFMSRRLREPRKMRHGDGGMFLLDGELRARLHAAFGPRALAFCPRKLISCPLLLSYSWAPVRPASSNLIPLRTPTYLLPNTHTFIRYPPGRNYTSTYRYTPRPPSRPRRCERPKLVGILRTRDCRTGICRYNSNDSTPNGST